MKQHPHEIIEEIIGEHGKLSFGQGNSKVSNAIATFSIPAGHTCPFALLCLSKSEKDTGKIKDGDHTMFRCFAASDEGRYPSARKARWNNFNLLRKCRTMEETANLIQISLPKYATLVRLHVSGDFYSEDYFLAWLNVAINNPQIIFYGYTKALPIWVKYKKFIPPNFRLTASIGGTHDHLIFKHKLKYAKVVFSVKEAELDGLEIDHDDSHAFKDAESFALLLHGTQPPGSLASKSRQALLNENLGGYSKKKEKNSQQEIRAVKIYVQYFPSLGKKKNEPLHTCKA
jgi:hypothetical protein